MRELDSDDHVGDCGGRRLGNVANKEEKKMTYYNPFFDDYGYYYYSINLGTQLEGFLLSHEYFSSCFSTSTNVCSPSHPSRIPATSSTPFSPSASASKCDTASLFRSSTAHNDDKDLKAHLLQRFSLCSTKELLARYAHVQAPDSHRLPRTLLPRFLSAESPLTTTIANDTFSVATPSEGWKASCLEKEIPTCPTKKRTVVNATGASDHHTNKEDDLPLACSSSTFSFETHWTLTDGLCHTADCYRFLHDQLTTFGSPETTPLDYSCPIGASLSSEVTLPALTSPRMTLWHHLFAEMLDHVGAAIPSLSLPTYTSSTPSCPSSPLLLLLFSLAQRFHRTTSSSASAAERVASLPQGRRPPQTPTARQGKGGEPPPSSYGTSVDTTAGTHETRIPKGWTWRNWLHTTMAPLRRKGWLDEGWMHVTKGEKEEEKEENARRDGCCHTRTEATPRGTPTSAETAFDSAAPPPFYPFFASTTPSVFKDCIQNHHFLCTLLQAHWTPRGEANEAQRRKERTNQATHPIPRAMAISVAGDLGKDGEQGAIAVVKESERQADAFPSSPATAMGHACDPRPFTTTPSPRTAVHPSWRTSVFWCAQQWTFFVARVLRWWMGLSVFYAQECRWVRHHTASSLEGDDVGEANTERRTKGEDHHHASPCTPHNDEEGWSSCWRKDERDDTISCPSSMVWTFAASRLPEWRVLPYFLRVSISRWADVLLGGGSHLLALLLRVLEEDLSEETDGGAGPVCAWHAVCHSSLAVGRSGASEAQKDEEGDVSSVVSPRHMRTTPSGCFPTTALLDKSCSIAMDHPTVDPSMGTEIPFRLVVVQGMLREILSIHAFLSATGSSPTCGGVASPFVSPLPPLRVSDPAQWCRPRWGKGVMGTKEDEPTWRRSSIARRRAKGAETDDTDEKEEEEEKESNEPCVDGSLAWCHGEKRLPKEDVLRSYDKTIWEGPPEDEDGKKDGKKIIKIIKSTHTLYDSWMAIERRCWTRFHERVCAGSLSSSKEASFGATHSMVPPSAGTPLSGTPPRKENSPSPVTVAMPSDVTSPISSSVRTSPTNDLSPSLFGVVRFPPIRLVGEGHHDGTRRAHPRDITEEAGGSGAAHVRWRSEGERIRSGAEGEDGCVASTAAVWEAPEARIHQGTQKDMGNAPRIARRRWQCWEEEEEEEGWEVLPPITIALHPLLQQWVEEHKNLPEEPQWARIARPCAFSPPAQQRTGVEGKDEESPEEGEHRSREMTPSSTCYRTGMTDDRMRRGPTEHGSGSPERNMAASPRTQLRKEGDVASLRRHGYHCIECRCTSLLSETLCSLLLFPLHSFWRLSPPLWVSPTERTARDVMQWSRGQKERRTPMDFRRSVCHEVALLAYYYLSCCGSHSPVFSIQPSLST